MIVTVPAHSGYMREVLDDLAQWWGEGAPVGVATVVATWRSAPRQPGATMLVHSDGTAVGSVSGGCVEGAVYDLAQQVINDGRPVLQRYGISDDDAFAVGLTCGGILDVFVERIDPDAFADFGALVDSVRADEPVAIVTVISAARQATEPAEPSGAVPAEPSGAVPAEPSGAVPAEPSGAVPAEPSGAVPAEPSGAVPAEPSGAVPAEPSGAVPAEPDPDRRLGRRLLVWADRTAGSLGTVRLDDAVTDDVRGLLAAGRTGTLQYGYNGERRGDELTVFVSTFAAPPRMIVFGAIDFAAAVARMGVFLGYRVTVCDARPVFATARRFPDAHEVIVDWPHRYLAAQAEAGRIDERTVVCVLTHDPKFDVPVLREALRMRLAYVGAMGSRRTHSDRMARLREAGMTDDELSRLAAPIGLDLGARTPEETAVSIAAEIIAGRWGGSGERLGRTGGRIHHEAADAEPDRGGPGSRDSAVPATAGG